MYAFDKLLGIIRDEALAKRFEPTAMHPSRRSFLQKIIAVFINGVVPVCMPINLETDDSNKPNYVPLPKDIADVNVFDAREQALSLL